MIAKLMDFFRFKRERLSFHDLLLLLFVLPAWIFPKKTRKFRIWPHL